MNSRSLFMPMFVFVITLVALSWGFSSNKQAVTLAAAEDELDEFEQNTGSVEQQTKNARAEQRLRRPVAMGLFDGGKALVVANRTSGSLSLIDLQRGEVVTEFDVTDRIDDMATADNGLLLLVNRDRHELIAVRLSGNRLEIVARISVPKYPVNICAIVSMNGEQEFAVASLWSRRVSLVRLKSDEGSTTVSLELKRKIDLPFAPLDQLFLANQRRLVVADAFGGSIAVIQFDQGIVESVQQIAGHNIRGMALKPDGMKIGLTHEVLDTDEPARLHAVRSAHLLVNVVREISVDDLLAKKAGADPLAVSELGVYGDGAADPADLIYLEDGSAVVALSGTNEIAIGMPYGRRSFEQVYGQRRPTSLKWDRARNQVYIANTFDDSISVLDLESESMQTISLGPGRALSSTEQGERLFYSADLSRDGWLSCHSCHSDGHTNGLKSDTRGDGAFGNPKQIPSLLGVGLTDTWAWDGHVKELNDQVADSIVSTMHGEQISGESLMHLTAYLRSLKPAPSLIDARDLRDDALLRDRIARGKQLFERQKCGSCHVGPLTYTTGGSFDVGLRDELGGEKFNPPSLRGVSQRSRFFHDGRAADLNEILGSFGHQNSGELSDEQIADLVEFLRSL